MLASPGLQPSLGFLGAGACTGLLSRLGALQRCQPRLRQRPGHSSVAQGATQPAEAKKCRLTINGREAEVTEGTTILSAAAQLGIHVRCCRCRAPCAAASARLAAAA